MFENLHNVDLSQTTDLNRELDTQEYIRNTMTQLSQNSNVVPKTRSKVKLEKLKLDDDESSAALARNEPDAPLVFYEAKEWEKVTEWSMFYK